MTDILWNRFMDYAEQFARAVDLDDDERNYKLEFAELAQESRQLFLDQNDEWFEHLRKALQRTNLVTWQYRATFFEDGKSRPDEIWRIVLNLWGPHAGPGNLDDFVADLRPLNPGRYTPGPSTCLGSVLLMGIEPTKYPPYKTRAVTKFLDLVGWAHRGAAGSPNERYSLFLESMDELKSLADERHMNIRDRLDAQGLMWTVMNLDAPETWPVERRRDFQEWRGDKTDPSNTPTPRETGPAPVLEEAAWQILDAGLVGSSSPLDPTIVTWTAENAKELHRVIYEGADTGEGTFISKLEKQLQGASKEVILLAAELIYLQVLPLSNVKAGTKINRVETVMSWASADAALPVNLRNGLEADGIFNGGMGFNIQLWQHIVWLCRFVITVRSNALRQDPLDSPQAFHSVAASTENDIPAIRYSLEYLAWPNFFEPVVSKDHRRLIRDTFAFEIGGASGNGDMEIATDLYEIRKAQEARTDDPVDWYVEPYLHQWSPSHHRRQRAWLVRQNQSGTSLIDRWLMEDFVSTKATHLGSPEPGATLERIQEAVNAGYEHIDYAERKIRAKEYYLFLSQMHDEDLVVTRSDNDFYIGVITGIATYALDPDSRLRRGVHWQPGPVNPGGALPAPLSRLVEDQGQIIDVTDALSLLETWLEAEVQPKEWAAETTEPAIDVVPELPEASEQLASDLNIGRGEIQEIFDLLQTRQQIVFYGPPGTGKTFLARKLAQYLVGEEHTEHVQLVQFHPSYAYEDFFEGFRPSKSSDGAVGFSLEPGPLRRVAAEAAAEGNRDKPYFLIIDEMNRANLAKVFGELYFLLEYRDHSINLQYNPDEQFVLPPNLFIIGTMNTADRSIAMVDAAIRRRFGFVELHPQEAPVEGLLDRWLEAEGWDRKPAALLKALNGTIEQSDRDFMIGPSYFMKEDAQTPKGLRRVWKYELLPLLEEHYFGRLSREQIHERFGLEALERQVDAANNAIPPDMAYPEPGVDMTESIGVNQNAIEGAAWKGSTEAER